MNKQLFIYNKPCYCQSDTVKRSYKIKIKTKRNYDDNIYYYNPIKKWIPRMRFRISRLPNIYNGYYWPIKQFIKFKESYKNDTYREIYKIITREKRINTIILIYYPSTNDWSPCTLFQGNKNLTIEDLNYFTQWAIKLRNIIMNLEFKHIYKSCLLLLQYNYIIHDVFYYIIQNYINNILFKPKLFDIV